MNKTKKLLIVAPYFPPHSGGLEKYAFEISKHLKRDYQWKIVVITSGERRGKDMKEEYHDLTVYRLSYSFKLSNSPIGIGWFSKVRNIIKIENPLIINIHTPVPGIGDIAALFTNGKPLVVTYHAGSMHKEKILSDIFIWVYEHIFMHFLLEKAASIICASDFVRFNFLKLYSKKSITITPGTDIKLFIPNPSKKNKRPTILFVGGLGKAEQHKDLQTLLEAIKIVQDSIHDISLMVVGDGDMRKEYEAYVAQLKIKKSVQFTGKLFGKQLVEAYQQAHVFVLPSTNESFGLVLIEAMACKVPVIGTDIGGIPEIIENNKNGIIIPPKNPIALAESIRNILCDKNFSLRIAENGYTKVIDCFQWTKKARETDSVFQKIIQNNSI